MAITPTSFLHLAAVQQLVVVLLYLLCHVRHGGVGHLHRVPVHYPPQLMVWGETGVDQLKKLGSDIGGNRLGKRRKICQHAAILEGQSWALDCFCHCDVFSTIN